MASGGDRHSDDRDLTVLAERRTSTIAELFPALVRCGEVQLDLARLDRRSLTTLARAGCSTWGDVCERFVGDLWSVPHAGQLTVERILAAARDQAAHYAHPGDELIGAIDVEREALSAEQVAATQFIRVLAQWARDARGAATVGDLVHSVADALPQDLAREFDKFRDLSLDEVVPAVEVDASQLIVQFLDDVGSDARFVVARHVHDAVGTLPTLESLAEPAGLTRERVRQLVKRGLASVEQCRARHDYRLLRWRAAELRESLGELCRADTSRTADAIDRAARGFVDPQGCTAGEFMLWFAGGFRREGDFLLSETAGRVSSVRSKVRQALANDWLLERAVLDERWVTAGLAARLGDHDIELLCSWRPIGDGWWLRWDGAVGDKVERVLRLALRAMSGAELNDAVGEGHALSSVQNVLSADARFTRVSMELDYALSEWEWEEYSTAAQEIRERVERAGGEAVLDDVVIELFNQFGLKEGTVRAYAASPAFVVDDGIIRMRRSDEHVAVNDRIASAAGLYVRADGCVVFHLPVDADVLRGSGRSIPNPLSVALRVRPGDQRTFVAAAASVRVSWPATAVTGAAIGSTRSVVEALDAKLGDVVRLVFDLDAETVGAVLVAGSSLSELTGLVLTDGGEAAEIAEAIRVDPFEVRAALSERGDDVVARLIPAARSSSKLDDALSLLDGLLG